MIFLLPQLRHAMVISHRNIGYRNIGISNIICYMAPFLSDAIYKGKSLGLSSAWHKHIYIYICSLGLINEYFFTSIRGINSLISFLSYFEIIYLYLFTLYCYISSFLRHHIEFKKPHSFIGFNISFFFN